MTFENKVQRFKKSKAVGSHFKSNKYEKLPLKNQHGVKSTIISEKQR